MAENNYPTIPYWERKRYYDTIFKEQKGRCAICGTPQEAIKRKLCLDHCHETGVIRGILCAKCNHGLGCFNDNIILLLKAVVYLRQSRGLRSDDVETWIDMEHDTI